MQSAGSLVALLSIALVATATQTWAQDITSAYTELDSDRDCAVDSVAGNGEGDWVRLVCPGYKGYPVILTYGDARESLFYGFPPPGEDGLPWESFDGFNSTAARIEWRLIREGEVEVPFATIHRWTVARPDDPDKNVEVLVIEKVGLLGFNEGCAVGMVMATGNPKANETARLIADEQAAGFTCGADERVTVDGSAPMPGFNRQDP